MVLAVYATFAPDAGKAGWSMWLGLAVSEVYLLARLWVKLVFYASEVSLFQSKLAHAGLRRRPAARLARLAVGRGDRQGVTGTTTSVVESPAYRTR